MQSACTWIVSIIKGVDATANFKVQISNKY